MAIDDWRAETQTRLALSHIYKTLQAKCSTEPSGSQVLNLVDDAAFYAYQRTKTILVHMGEFTLHDGDHLFRVLNLMERLVPHAVVESLSPPELMLLILSAFFHDIGMAPEVKTVLSWKKIWDISPTLSDDKDRDEYSKFSRYYAAKPDQQLQISTLASIGDNSGVDLVKAYLITDYIRITHAQRAREIIQADWVDKIVYRDVNLSTEFSSICFSHNEDAFELLELDRNYLCGPDTFACLPLVAVILRLADLLDFDGKRTPQVLFSHLFVRHPVSIKEWTKHRAVEAWTISPKSIQFHAKCKHPAIEASIHSFCDIIDAELSACNNVISVVNDFNKSSRRDLILELPFKVDRSKIETQKDVFGKPLYFYRKSQFNLSKKQVIDLLMGTKLYGDPEVALRELLQNSIDACLLRDALEKSWGNPYTPSITVRYGTENGEDILEVIDNGTGMDQYIIDSYYSKVGSSFYKSSDFYNLKSESNALFTPTSRFGIGILSTFMVADSIEVETRRVYAPHESSDPLRVTVEGQEGIFWIRSGERKTPGTSTKLILRKSKNPWERMNPVEFIKSVESIVPNPPFQIAIESESDKKTIDESSFIDVVAETLKDHNWRSHENVAEFEVTLSDSKRGFIGSAIVAVLERNGFPVDKIDVHSKTVDVDGQSFSLEKSIRVDGTKIRINSTSIEIDDNADISQSVSISTLADSKSKLSLHGIEVSASLFPESWNMQKNQVRLNWPLPLLLVIDICGQRDLDLNSARTQIIMSEKWTELEEELSFTIFSRVVEQISAEYWEKLKTILLASTKNPNFLAGINRIK
jgi:molecular chaperone HtpG